MAAVAVLIGAMAGVFVMGGSAGASPGDVQADLFRLLNAATDQCADLPVEAQIGREVVQQPCVGQPTQVWRAEQVPTSFDFRIVNNTNGLCMDLRRAGSAGDPVPVVLAQCSGKLASQEWQFAITVGFPGPLKVVNLLTGLCLEVKDGSLAAGAPLQVSACDDSVAHQDWFKLPGRVLA